MNRWLLLWGALALAVSAAADEPPPGTATTAAAENQAAQASPVEETAHPPETATVPPPAAKVSTRRLARQSIESDQPDDHMEAMLATLQPFVVPGLGTLATLAVAGALLLWRRHTAVHRLPEFAVEPRLGGSHAAGIGGVVSFADPMQPPSSQHRLRPDSFSLP